MTRWNCLAGVVLLAACSTEPEPALTISGIVRSEATQTPVAGATVGLGFRSAFSPTTQILINVTTGSDGRFLIETGPPPGYSHPNCATLHLEVSAPGHISETWVPIGGADSPACDAGMVEVGPIELHLDDSE